MLKTAYSVALATAILASSGAAFAAEQYEITDYERVLIAPTPCKETKANAVENLTIDVPVAVVQPRS
jgi:hypothetical protein